MIVVETYVCLLLASMFVPFIDSGQKRKSVWSQSMNLSCRLGFQPMVLPALQRKLWGTQPTAHLPFNTYHLCLVSSPSAQEPLNLKNQSKSKLFQCAGNGMSLPCVAFATLICVIALQPVDASKH